MKALFFLAVFMTFPSLCLAEGQGQLFTVCVAQQCGYVDIKGQWAIKPQFEAANPFDAKGRAWVRDDTGAIGQINMKGEWLVDPSIFHARDFKDGLAMFSRDNEHYGWINPAGEVVIEPIFNDFSTATDFIDGLALVNIDEKYGFINTKGEWVIEPEFTYLLEFSPNGLAVASLDYNSGVGYIDKKGEWAIEPTFFSAGDFNEHGLARALSGLDQFGFINSKGEWVIEPIFTHDDLGTFDANGLVRAKSGDKWGFFNIKGEWAIKPIFDSAHAFDEKNQAIVELDGKEGTINSEGNWIIKPVFNPPLFNFENDLSWAKVNGKSGYINRKGEWVIETPWVTEIGFDYAGSFQEGLAKAISNGREGYLNMKGEWVIGPTDSFKDGSYFYGGLAMVTLPDNNYAYINSKGDIVINIPASFGYPLYFEPNGLAQVSIKGDNEKHHYIDKAGNSRLLIGYDENAESAIHWKHEKAVKYLSNQGERPVSVETLCGQEVAKNAAGEIIWPEKSAAQICEEQAQAEEAAQRREEQQFAEVLRITEEKARRERATMHHRPSSPDLDAEITRRLEEIDRREKPLLIQ